MFESDLIDMIKAQIELEKNTHERILELEEIVANLAAKLFLAEMRFDTEKHAKILQTMLDLLEQVEPEDPSIKFWGKETRNYVDALTAKKELVKHITVETKMLKHVEKEIKKTNDEAIKELFKHVADDERKHHKIMETILKKAFKMISIP